MHSVARGDIVLTAYMTVSATPMSSLFVLQQVVRELAFAAGVTCCIRVVISDASPSRWPLLQLLEPLLIAIVSFNCQNLATAVWCGNAQQVDAYSNTAPYGDR